MVPDLTGVTRLMASGTGAYARKADGSWMVAGSAGPLGKGRTPPTLTVFTPISAPAAP